MYWTMTGLKLPTLYTVKQKENSFLLDAKIDPPAAINKLVPEMLSNLVMDCVRTSPVKRPKNMNEVATRLEVMRHAIAKADPAFHNGEAAQDCKIYQDQVNRENARNEERYTDGVNFFNQGLLDNAEQKFRAIHSGTHLADAQNYLSSKIPAAKQQAAAQGAESAMSAKFEQAKEAFNNNAFTSAKSGFSQVASGAHQSEAQAYLQKIQQYEQFMQQGDSAAAGKNYQAAMSAYQNAANIKGDGPGDPNGKLSSVGRMMKSGSLAARLRP